jgi:hypothetical protein
MSINYAAVVTLRQDPALDVPQSTQSVYKSELVQSEPEKTVSCCHAPMSRL